MLHCAIWVLVISAGLVTATGFVALTLRHYDRQIGFIARRLK